MKTSAYRLGEYKIIEYDYAEVSWESHFGLGSQREGRCCVKGKILFICRWTSEDAGFLKNEFLGHLRKLPKWEKTEYYSPRFEVYSCLSGRKISQKEIRQTFQVRSYDSADASKEGQPSRCPSYRLNRYEITYGRNGQVYWKTWGGFNKVRLGRCLIMEDILFFGSLEEERTCAKRDFFSHLNSLPLWEGARFFCTTLDLRYCETGESLRLENAEAKTRDALLIREDEREGALRFGRFSGVPHKFHRRTISEVGSSLRPILSSVWAAVECRLIKLQGWIKKTLPDNFLK